MIPFWQAAGFDSSFNFDNRSWLIDVVKLIAPSLTLLTDAVDMARYLFVDNLEYKEEAIAVLKSEPVKPILLALSQAFNSTADLNAETAGNLIQSVAKSLSLKKGAIMKPLRCALSGDIHGPDLIPSLLLLAQRDLVLSRLETALAL